MVKLADEIEAQTDIAMATARDFDDDEVATSVRYVASDDLFVIVLKSGRRVVIPKEDLQDIADASPGDAAQVELVAMNSALTWDTLDVDFGVKGLANGLYGNERWMKQLDERRRRNAAAALKRTA